MYTGFFFILKETQMKYDSSVIIKLVLFQITVIALSNWIVNYHLDIFDYIVSYAAFTFPLVVVATDLTVRTLGTDVGRRVVGLTFIPAILISMLIVYLTGAPPEVAYRIGAGSGCSYLVSTLLDVYVFQYFRQHCKQWWVAPALSSVMTMFIDTYTFYFVAFYKNVGAVYEQDWIPAATNHAIIKIIICLIIVLPLYGVLLNYIQKRILKV
jgi:uncharacterized integral membrane protein (TIGR00697 family)